MATNLKIEGNFLVLHDSASPFNEVFRSPRALCNFIYYQKNTVDYFEFKSQIGSFVKDTLLYNFTDLIDSRTGLAFNSATELREFLSLNLGAQLNPVQVIRTTGWATYVDTQYPNAVSAFTLPATTDTILTNNIGGKVDSQKPTDVDTFYYQSKMTLTSIVGTFTVGETVTGGTSGATATVLVVGVSYLYLRQVVGTFVDTESISGGSSGATATVSGTPTTGRITGRNGDSLDLMLYFKAIPSVTNQYLDIWIDIGGSVGQLYRQTFSFPRGAGVERGILYAIPSGYTLDTWEANGGAVYVYSDNSVDIHSINFNFDRSHKANT